MQSVLFFFFFFKETLHLNELAKAGSGPFATVSGCSSLLSHLWQVHTFMLSACRLQASEFGNPALARQPRFSNRDTLKGAGGSELMAS